MKMDGGGVGAASTAGRFRIDLVHPRRLATIMGPALAQNQNPPLFHTSFNRHTDVNWTTPERPMAVWARVLGVSELEPLAVCDEGAPEYDSLPQGLDPIIPRMNHTSMVSAHTGNQNIIAIFAL